MSTTVVNLRQAAYDVYIGRPRKGEVWRWGNPFSHIPAGTKAEFVVGSRDEAIERFRQWLLTSEDERAVWMRRHVGELKGKRLGCFCQPLSCHGGVLADLAEHQATLLELEERLDLARDEGDEGWKDQIAAEIDQLHRAIRQR